MKKIGIYTMQSQNYGNRLQNYALQEVLTKLGYKVRTFSTISKIDLKDQFIKFHPLYNFLNENIIYIILCIRKFIRNFIKYDSARNYYLFDKKIKFTKDVISVNNIIIKNLQSYHALVAGSDQIWNTTFSDVVSVNSFFPFDHERKIAYAASFGLIDIPYDDNIANCLRNFKEISVREESGINIIRKIAQREASLVIDPTLLISKEEWKKVSKEPKGAKKSFILTYFLSPKCEEAEKTLEKVSSGKLLYELLDPNDDVASKAGPSEFLWLFEHAELILTDSFHACVFSIIFNKPFIVYDRNWDKGNMNSRLETLLSMLNLERKYANAGLGNDIWEHDYTSAYKIIDYEREKALSFLKKALNE